MGATGQEGDDQNRVLLPDIRNKNDNYNSKNYKWLAVSWISVSRIRIHFQMCPLAVPRQQWLPGVAVGQSANRQPTAAGQRQPTNSPTANKPTDKQALVSLPPLPSFQTASSSSSRRSIHQPFFTSAAQQQQHSLSTVPSADLTFCLTVDSVAQRAFFALSSKQVVAPAPPASTRGSFSCSSSNSEAFYKSLSSSNSSSRTVAPLT